MTVLAIDIETYSDELIENGVYKYVDSNNFKILLFAYAFNDEDVTIVDLESGEKLPDKVIAALSDRNIVKTAFNAQFERVCIDRYFNIKTENWECTMVKALSLGFPGGLDSVGKVIGLDPDKQKMGIGKKLINIFSVLRKVKKGNNQLSMLKEKIRILPTDRPEEWKQFKEYCIRDVEVERAIRNKLSQFKTLDAEMDLYRLDQKINDRGVLIDLKMAENAIAIDTEQTNRLTKIFQDATDLENPNSLVELKNYIKTKTGETVKSITKKNLPELQEKFKGHDDIITALDVRQRLSKTSISKYKKMINVACKDGRARGLLQFYGANRTGRWAGRLIQVQNLPQNHINDLDTAREIVKNGDLDFLEMMYDNPSDVLSQCIRPAIIPAPGKKFIVSDFSAIEARVIAWLAGEDWRIDVFNSHGKIYEASASEMFKVPIEQITKGSSLRQKGKIAELALGYQGAAGALKQMGALNMGLTEEELPELVKQWRSSNPNIVQFWWDTESKVREAIENRTTVKIKNNLKVIYQSGILFIELPSGRRLAYVKPKIMDHDKFPGRQKIVFQEINPRTYQWNEVDTYGGKLVENIVQLTGAGKIDDAITIVFQRNKVHPVREYLSSLKWDVVKRVETLLTDYLGAEDTIYTRAVIRTHLVAAVARIMKPGCKYDTMLTLTGPQGIGKSTFIRYLGKNWFNDSLDTVKGKEAYEQLQGSWLIEMGELTATRKADIEAVKLFLSKTEDIYRVAYGKRTSRFKRQCIFWGTSNDKEFLRDKTGDRRTWPVDCGLVEIKKSIFNDLKDEVDQIWAEAVELYKSGHKLYLVGQEAEEAIKQQRSHAEDSPKTGLIEEYLERDYPINWDDMDLYERRNYLDDADDFDSAASTHTMKKDKTCVMEIWCELFKGDPKSLTPILSREINDILRTLNGWERAKGALRFGKIYGTQRAFIRKQKKNSVYT